MKSKRKKILEWLNDSFKHSLNNEENAVLSSSKTVIGKLPNNVINKINTYELHKTNIRLSVLIQWFYTERSPIRLYSISISQVGFIVSYSINETSITADFVKELDYNRLISYVGEFLTNREIHLPSKKIV